MGNKTYSKKRQFGLPRFVSFFALVVTVDNNQLLPINYEYKTIIITLDFL